MAAGGSLPPVVRVPVAGFLAWLVPGLGHIFVGDRVRGIIFLVTIAVTFWTGVAIGGVADSVQPQERKTWFMAQSCTGLHALAAYAWGERVGRGEDEPLEARAHWLSMETGVVYCGISGLLNVLIIIDALSRADSLTTATSAGVRPRSKARKGVT